VSLPVLCFSQTKSEELVDERLDSVMDDEEMSSGVEDDEGMSAKPPKRPTVQSTKVKASPATASKKGKTT